MELRIVGFAAGACAMLIACVSAQAQQNLTQRIAAKSGETIELFNVFAQVNCRSILLATPEVEVLEGPAELTLTVKEQMVPVPALRLPQQVERRNGYGRYRQGRPPN